MKRADKPSVNPLLTRAGDPLDCRQFIGAESELPNGTQILAQLLDAAGTHEHGSHARIAQHPRDRELCKSLAAGACDLVQCADLAQNVRRNVLRQQETRAARRA